MLQIHQDKSILSAQEEQTIPASELRCMPHIQPVQSATYSLSFAYTRDTHSREILAASFNVLKPLSV